MKKLLTVITTVAIAVSMAMPVFAQSFVSSVTAGGAPGFIAGGTIGNIIGSDGNKGEEITEDQVVITPVGGSEESDITEEEKKELEEAYKDLEEGKASISEDLGNQLGGNYTPTEVFSITPKPDSSLGQQQDGESYEFTFTTGTDPHTNIVAACLVDGEWVSAISTVNNGDGTVTVVLPQMGTVAFFTVENDNEEIVTIDEEAGTEREIIGHVVDEDGKILSTDYQECIIVTDITEIEEVVYLTEEEKDIIADFYNGIISGKIKLGEDCPELDALVKEKLGEDKNADDLVILDLFDVKVLCHELKTYLPPEGTTIELTFEIDAPADAEVFVVTYKNGKVVLADNCTNNGDGTVSASFENFCPVAFLVSEEVAEVVGDGGVCAICKGKFVYKASPIPAICLTCFVIIVAIICAVAGGVYKYIKDKNKEETPADNQEG